MVTRAYSIRNLSDALTVSPQAYASLRVDDTSDPACADGHRFLTFADGEATAAKFRPTIALIAKFRLYDLRHTFATPQAEVGPRNPAFLLGHFAALKLPVRLLLSSFHFSLGLRPNSRKGVGPAFVTILPNLPVDQRFNSFYSANCNTSPAYVSRFPINGNRFA